MPEPIFVRFIGTGGSTPFDASGMPCIALKFKKDLLIFDIGEGSQLSLMSKGLHPISSKLTIFITHLHADHTAGLPGLLHTLKIADRRKPVWVVGPKNIHSFVENISKAFFLQELPFDLNILEIHSPETTPEVLDRERYLIRCFPTKHTYDSVGYIFKEKKIPGKFNEKRAEKLGIPQSPLRKKLKEGKSVILSNGKKIKPKEVIGPPRKGRKIVYTGDTRPTREIIKNSRKASLLIHDGAFLKDNVEKAKERYHSTVEEAVSVAKKAKVNALALVHSSSRYKGEKNRIKEEAQKAAKGKIKVFVPNDGDQVKIDLTSITYKRSRN